MELLDFGEAGENESLYDQDEPLIRQDRAKALLESGQLHEAVVMLEEITADYPELWSAYNNLALAYFYSGNVTKAKQTVFEVLEKMKAISMPCATSLYSAITRGKMKKSEN